MEMWPSPPLEEPPHKVEVSEMGDFENRDGRHTCRVVRLLSINDKYVRIDYVEMAIQIIKKKQINMMCFCRVVVILGLR